MIIRARGLKSNKQLNEIRESTCSRSSMHKCTWLPFLCFNEQLASGRLPQMNVSFRELHLKNLLSWRRIDFLARSNCLHSKASFPNARSNTKMESKPWLFHLENTKFQTGKSLSFFFSWRTHLREIHVQF